jgi:RNA polymerase sigma-70 factor (ECF subfamily)
MAAPDTMHLSAEQSLVAAVLAKDRKATAEFVNLHIDAVFAFVRRRLAPRYEAADDLVQDVFLEAWQALPGFRAQASLRTWLLGIARHKVQDYYRAKLRVFLDIDDEAPPAVAAGFDVTLDDQHQAERIEGALAQLPEHYQVALRWRYWEQWSAEDMARAMGKSEKAVERMLARAREQFRRCYGG